MSRCLLLHWRTADPFVPLVRNPPGPAAGPPTPLGNGDESQIRLDCALGVPWAESWGRSAETGREGMRRLCPPGNHHVESTDAKTQTRFMLALVRGAAFATLLVLAASATAAELSLKTIALPGPRAFPESISSSADGTLFIGSLAAGGIARAKTGAPRATTWIRPGYYGSRSILGVLADERAGILWACSNDMSAMGVVAPGTASGSWLKGFNLKTGKGEISVKLPNEHSICNDIALTSDGSVFVTNTAAPEILKLSADRKHLDVWVTDPLFPRPDKGPGLDGIAFGDDGNLYVDTYASAELFRINVSRALPGGVTKLQPSRPLVLTDALRPIGGNRFLMIEGAGRLDRVEFHGDTATIETLRDGFTVPTGVTPVGATAWVSEGQLSYLFDASKKHQKPNLPFKLYGVPLGTP